jgi:hypothetical protein
MRRTTFILFAAIWMQISELSFGVTIPIDFQGPEQSFNGTVDLTGTLSAEGQGTAFNPLTKAIEPFSTTPPTTHAIGLISGPVALDTQPSSGAPASFEFVGDQLTNIANFDMQLLDVPEAFFTAPITITTNSKVTLLKSFTVDLTNSLSELHFQQSAAATLAPTGPGTGTFQIPGSITSIFDGLFATIAGIIVLPLGGGSGSVPFLIEGTYSITGPPGNAKVALDGTGFYANTLTPTGGDFAYMLSAPLALTISASLNLPNTVTVSFDFHLEQSGLVIPEPTSLTLLGIGCVALAICRWRSTREQQR